MRRSFLLIVALALAPTLSWAQTPPDSWENLKQLQAGHKVKLTAMDLKVWDGRVVGVSDDAITIRLLRSQQEITVDRPKVYRVRDLERSRRARNALIGLVVGSAIGAVWVAKKGEDLVPWGKAVVAIGIFGGPGAAVGALFPDTQPTIYKTPVQKVDMSIAVR